VLLILTPDAHSSSNFPPDMERTKLFYIEDEASLGKIVKDTLEKQGYDIVWETDGAKVISRLENYHPDICVIDIMLPNIDGYSLSGTIRGMFKDLPIIFLTAKTGTAEVIKGFESGGTDYIRKPFSIEELIARIENQLALHGNKGIIISGQEIIRIGTYKLDLLKHELTSLSDNIKLTNRDMQVIRMLFANRNRQTSRKDLLLNVWGDDSYFNSRTLDVYIRKIRRYLADDPEIKILTLKGIGYIFIVPEK
jgi:DNA-binding response OmpR family regulator